MDSVECFKCPTKGKRGPSKARPNDNLSKKFWEFGVSIYDSTMIERAVVA